MKKFFDLCKKNSIRFLPSPKGLVAPLEHCGGLTVKEACATLKPLTKEAGLRVSILKPSFEYPEPALYVGKALEEKSISDSHADSIKHLEGLK